MHGQGIPDLTEGNLNLNYGGADGGLPSGGPALVHRYKGQYGYVTDTESNLIYCQNRFYDPYSARWITRDPSGLDGGINTYQYCLGDPVNNVDPSGLSDWSVVAADAILYSLGFTSADAAAKAAIRLYMKVSPDGLADDVYFPEQAGWVYRNLGRFYYSHGDPRRNTASSSFHGPLPVVSEKLIGTWHTHPWSGMIVVGPLPPREEWTSNRFSGYRFDGSHWSGDLANYDGFGGDRPHVGYVGTPDGTIKKYVPSVVFIPHYGLIGIPYGGTTSVIGRWGG